MSTEVHARQPALPTASAPELPLLILPDDWQRRFAEPSADWLEPLCRILPGYFAGQRWFAAKGKALAALAIVRQLLWQQRWLLLRVDVELRDEATQAYWLPLAIRWDDAPADGEAIAPTDALARVRQAGRAGTLHDAFASAAFCRALLIAMRQGARLDGAGGSLVGSSTAAFDALAGDDLERLPVRRASASSSNTALLVGDRLFLKAYRRLAAGVNAEVEMGRFLTDASPYAHIAPLAGALEHRARDGTVTALAMLQGGIVSQGDAWSHTLAALAALIGEALAHPAAEARRSGQWAHWSTLGRRTGELHCALARTTGDPAFDPQAASRAELRCWVRQVGDEAARTLDLLASQRPLLPDALQTRARRLLAARTAVLARIEALQPMADDVQITRFHGDYHLGQVLVVGDDFCIIDFEGEPGRPPAERRRKHSPLRDVAGMLRSFNYAASSALADALAAGAPAALVEPLLADWEAHARAAFLDGYRDAVRGAPLAPHAEQTDAALLELFLIEKAFYELRYELCHRPDWVHVPLGGLCELLLGDPNA